MGLLARREHSARELSHKLKSRDYDEVSIQAVIESLIDEGLQSDDRFAEQFTRSRVEKGYGPIRIRQELRERGIADSLISHYLDVNDPEWPRRAQKAREKRFGRGLPGEYREQARQARFLQQRGYTSEQIMRIIKAGDE
jgi:regulatory protein